MDPQDDLIDQDITLTVLIPSGQETTATVHGSKPVMDVLVMLCAQHHLVPSDHVIKLISANQNNINFKPNSMIGSLEFETVVLQAKGNDAKQKKPHIPVATVRLLINYKKSHKAVVRVNPTVPLAELMPVVCEKCEFDPDVTVLLRTYQSEEPLDLTKTLNDYGIRELYAKQIKGADEEQKTSAKETNHREKGNKGFFGLFKKNKKTSEQAVTDSAPTSPELNGQYTDRVNGINGHCNLPMIPADMPKKRRAPQPPTTASQSVACELHTKDFSDLSETDPAEKQVPLSRISSTESSLKRTKRRAPPPPLEGPTPSLSDNKAEDDMAGKRSDKYRACVAERCPVIAKVMSELAESLQARKQRTLSSANFFNSPATSLNQPAENPPGLFSDHHTPEAELKAIPDCQLLRKSSEREGLTTFIVVPQRRQQSRECFEMPLTLQTPDTVKTEQDLSPGDLDALEISSTESVETIPTDVFTDGDSISDESEHISDILLLEEENQAWIDIESEHSELNEEDQCITPKNIERDILRCLGEMNDSELRESWEKTADRSPTDCFVEQEDVEEHPLVLVETANEKDWVEVYKDRRRKFLCGHNEGKNLNVFGRIQREFTKTMEEMDFPSPPPPVYWHENITENEEDEENGSKLEKQTSDEDIDQEVNFDFNINSKPKYATPVTPDKLNNTEPISSDAESNCSFTPESHGTAFLTKSHSNFDPCPPAKVSLFALAVFKKAKRPKPGWDLPTALGDGNSPCTHTVIDVQSEYGSVHFM